MSTGNTTTIDEQLRRQVQELGAHIGHTPLHRITRLLNKPGVTTYAKKEWEQLRIKGFDLVNQIIAETKGIGDKTVQKKINDLVNGLNVMLSSKGGMSRFTGREDAPLTKKIKF